MSVVLDDADARAVVYALSALERGRRLGGHPVPAEVISVRQRITVQIVARSRQAVRAERRELSPMENLGTRQAAHRLGWSQRTVQRNATLLHGRRVGNVWTFPAHIVETIATQQEPIQEKV